MDFLLEINTDSAVFHEGSAKGDACLDAEHICYGQALRVAEMIRAVARHVEERGLDSTWTIIRDSNDNDVGSFALKPDGYQPVERAYE